MERIPLILDVDTGVDDSLAILYACASPEVELLAVTTVAGNVPARQVATNTRAVLELAGRSEVPVFLGAEKPLVRPLHTAEDTHGSLGLGHATLSEAREPLAPGHAADHLIEAIGARPGEVLLVTLGPLTNLALALDREPELPRLLRGYALMGGAYRTSGNTTPTAEWNVHVDPDAAKAVFAAWADATAPSEATGTTPAVARPLAMGLDVTELLPFTPADLARFAIRAGCSAAEVGAVLQAETAGPPEIANPLVRFVSDALRFYFEFHREFDGFYGAYIHDPFAVAAALDRSLVTTRPLFVDVEATPGLTNGMTVADWRGLTRRPANLDVAVDGETARFIDRWIDRVGGLAARPVDVAR